MHSTSQTFSVNGQSIHAMVGGPNDAPVMVFLHGFPEYWAAWAQVAEFFADTHHIVLPDQRGFNLSSKPAAREAYDTKHMVADLAELVDQLSPDGPIVLCGHDWGASVAYAFAMRHGDRVSRLVIANGVHPICFQKALLAGGPQTDASQYMNVLRAEGAEQRLSANRFEKLLRMFEKFSAAPWLTDDIRESYRAAWSQPGAMSAMLNWYRGSPMIVPESGAPRQDFAITQSMREKYHLSMPHLLIWGEDDTALLGESREDLPLFCDELQVQLVANASHWILHERPELVAELMKKFLQG